MNYCSIPGCTTCKERKLADAVRLTADAVVKAADAWVCGVNKTKLDLPQDAALRSAVLAHRKAKAEQAKEEASRG